MSGVSFSLAGRTALVTGASSGIGRAIAGALAGAGAAVAVHHRAEPEDAAATLNQLAPAARPHIAIAGDLVEVGAADRLVEEAGRAFGGIDILVVNAAIEQRSDWLEVTSDNLCEHFRVNFAATVRLLQLCLPPMVERGWGRVLTIGSIQQVRPNPRSIPYAALKSAQSNLVRNLAREVAARGVTVNNLAPGAIVTPRSAEALADPAFRTLVESKIPAGRVGAPEDCAGAALLLCSDAGAYITGADLFVDGGWNINDR